MAKYKLTYLPRFKAWAVEYETTKYGRFTCISTNLANLLVTYRQFA